MENQTNGQKGKRATRNKQDLCLRLLIQNICSEDCNIASFLLKLNLAKGYTDSNTNIDCNIFEANMEKIYLYVGRIRNHN